MKLVFAAPGEYNPIQSVEVGPLIPLQLTERDPQTITLHAKHVRASYVAPPPMKGGGLPPVVTLKQLVIADRVKPSFVKIRSSYLPPESLAFTSTTLFRSARALPAVVEQLT